MVASDIILDPATICGDFNLCSPRDSTQPVTTNIFTLLQALADLLRTLILKYSDSAGLCSKQSAPSLGPQSKESFYVGNKSLPHTQSFSARDRPHSHTKKPRYPQSGNIAFLQIGDIHLDLQYAEVNHY